MGKISFETGNEASAPTYIVPVNKSGDQVNPSTDEKLDDIKAVNQQIRDELSLPVEDIVNLTASTSPPTSADTDFSAAIDAARGNAVVIALYSDQTPASVKIEGSVDNAYFYEMNGVDVDLATWSTAKFNVYKIEPYTRYIKVTLHTPSVAPSKLIMDVRAVRS